MAATPPARDQQLADVLTVAHQLKDELVKVQRAQKDLGEHVDSVVAEERRRVNFKIVIITVIALMLVGGVVYSWVDRTRIENRFTDACHRQVAVNQATEQLYRTDIALSAPVLKQVRSLPKSQDLYPGVTVGQELKLYQKQLDAIHFYFTQLHDVRC